MEDIKVSIIVPAYNAEKYLNICLDSLINQSHKNIEIIVVNDGSKDYTLKICKEYQKKDKRIVIIDQKNSGVSTARNNAIEKSTGDYLMFCDSDDYFGEHRVENMLKCVKKDVEVVISNMTIFDKNNNYREISSKYDNKSFAYNDILLDIINSNCFSNVWKLLIRKTDVKEIKFNKDIKYGEDLLFLYEVVKDKKIYYTKCNDYYYFDNDESAVHKTDFDSIKKYIDDNYYVFNYIKNDNSNYNNIEIITNNRFLSKFSYACLRASRSHKYKDFKKFVIDNNTIDKNKINLKLVDYENRSNKFRMFLLVNKSYLLYYLYNRLISLIKRGA